MSAAGKLIIPSPVPYEFVDSVLQQADGKLVVTGQSNGLSLARLNLDGSLDITFGTDGRLTQSVLADLINYGPGTIQQKNGKLLLLGHIRNGSDSDISLIRLNLDGSLDTTFGENGKLTIPLEPNSSIGYRITEQADGKLMVVGTSANVSNFAVIDSYLSFVRLNADGSLDSAFGDQGALLIPSENSYSDSILQIDEKLVVGTYSYNFDAGAFYCSLMRLNADGSRDLTYGNEGNLVLPFGIENLYSGPKIVQQSDGKLVVVEIGLNGDSYDISVTRLNIDGSLDRTFGIGGNVMMPVGQAYSRLGITLQADGKLVVAGTSINSEDADFCVFRFNIDGSLDNAFGIDGKLYIPVGESSDYGKGVIQQSDGKLVVVGESINKGNYDFSVIRLNTDGSLDTTFSPGINTLQQMGSASFTEGENPRILAPSGQIRDAELIYAGSYAGATLTLARQGGTQAQDVFSSSGTMTALNLGSYFAVDGTTIGRVTANGNGTLVLTFNSNATQSLVNKAMQQIAYANTSDAPPSTVAIDWTFNDGNTGAQGIGGALSVTSTSYVVITPTNDAPYLATSIPAQRFAADRPFSFQLPFVDPDLELLTYTVTMADGTGVPPWLTFNRDTQSFSATPTSNDLGTFNFKIRVTDAAGVSAYGSMNVTVYENIAPVLANALEDRSVTLGSSLNFAFAGNTFTDVDSPSLTYTATLANGAAMPTWLSFDPATRMFSGTPAAADVGSLSIRVTASDGSLSASDVFSLVVNAYFEPVVDDSSVATYARSANQYTIRFDPVSKDLLVTDTDPQQYEVRKFTNAKRIEFEDLTLNLAVSDLADTIAEPALNRIAELYVAFFNRVPDGDGMEFWLGQYRQGKTINDIADAFYNAGVYFSDLTGYRADMSNDDFIHIVYRNVLGRPEGADQEGLAFWRAELDSGRSAKGTLVSSILDAAHGSTFSDPTNPYHWVQKLLDNKLEVAKQVSVDWGVNYNSSEDSIAKGQAIAAAITPDDTSVAISLVGVVVADMV